MLDSFRLKMAATKLWLVRRFSAFHAWLGPEITSIRGHLNAPELFKIATTFVTLLTTLHAIAASLPMLSLIDGWLPTLISIAVAVADGARRMAAGADIAVSAGPGLSPILVTPSPDRPMVITPPPDQEPNLVPPIVVPQAPEQPAVIMTPAHPEEPSNG
jgi:hypothetical protein